MQSGMSAITHIQIVLFFLLCSCIPSSTSQLNQKNNPQTYRIPEATEDIELYPHYDDFYYISSNNSYNLSNTHHILYYPPQYMHSYPSNQKYQNEKTIRHIVKKGETLYRIAKQYQTSIEAICEMNALPNATSIKVGQTLLIPLHKSQEYSTSPYNRDNPTFHKELPSQQFIWPVYRVEILPSHHKSSSAPLGVLIKSLPQSKVIASADGKVVKIGYMRGFGNFVVISHEKNFYTVYSPLATISVTQGQYVKRGAPIGILSDRSPHLHFQIHRAGKPINPLNYLAH